MIAFYEKNEMPLRVSRVKDMNFSAHLHKQAEFFLLLEGEITVTVNGESYPVRKGDLLAAFPNMVHGYQSQQSNSGIMIIFNPELAGEWNYKLTHFTNGLPVVPQERIHPDIPYCMKSIANTPILPENLPLLKGYLLVLVSRLCACIDLVPAARKEDFDLVHRALLYVTENFREPLSLERVAKELGVSRCYLSRMFSRKVGSGFNSYINSLRVGLAQHLLENPGLPVAEVAMECGFESLRTFNRTFQLQLGTSPRAYRSQLGKTSAQPLG